MRRIIGYFASHGIVTNWFILLVMIAGIFGFTQLRRRVWPPLDLDYATVNVSWPGISALEIEETITIPIEKKLKSLEGIDRMVSTTGDGYASFQLDATPGIPIDITIDKIRTAINSIADFPKDAGRPKVARMDSWNRVMLLFVYGPEDLDVLQKVADDFKNNLLASKEITQITSWGMPGKEIQITLSPGILQTYGLSVRDIREAIRSSDLNVSAGMVQTDIENLQIRSYGRQTSVTTIMEIPIPIHGKTIPLGRIAQVSEEWLGNVVYTRANGKPAVGFDIMYSNKEDVLAISEAVDKIVAESTDEYGGLVTFKPFIRDSDQIEERLGTMSLSGLFGLVLVVLILGIFLNIRLSFWVAFGIPFSFLGLFFIEWLLGITINEMSLFGMIMVLGILVDDGIVIGENIWSHWKNLDKSPLQAAIDGTLEVLPPVVVSIITTMVAFTPYFFIYGEMGQYTSQIGLVLILSLAFSLVEAAIILPVHLAHSKALRSSGKSNRMRRGLDRLQEGLIHKLYAPLLKTALSHRVLSLALMGTILLVLAGAMIGNHVKSTFFPEIEMPYSFGEISFPAGTSVTVVDDVRDRISAEALLMGSEAEWTLPEEGYDNAIVDILSWGNSRQAWVYLILIPNDVRPFTSSEFSSALNARIGVIPEAENFKMGEGSAFGGYPISVRFVGEDSVALNKAATLLKGELSRIKGVKDIQDDTPMGAKELVYDINNKGRALGITAASLALQIRNLWYGSEAIHLSDGPRRIPVVLRMDISNRDSINRLDRYPVQNPAGDWIPVGDIINYQEERGLHQIKRENGFKAIRINAGFDTSKNDLNVVLAEMNEEIVPRILAEVPGIVMSAGGQAESVKRMVKSMAFSMTGAFIIMFSILMIATGSLGQAVIIMILIPFGFVGAVFGHIIMGLPLSFISILGVLALAGIIINDSVVFISAYNRMVRKEGIPCNQAIFRVGMKRFRPIVMTTLTTSIGLSPLIFQKSAGGQFLIPVAVSITFGTIFGTFLTLILLPCVLSLMSESGQKRAERREKRQKKRSSGILNCETGQ